MKIWIITLLAGTLGTSLPIMIQESRMDDYARILKKISNKELDFMIPDHLNIFSPSPAKDFYVYLVTPYPRHIAKKYGGNLIPELVTILQRDESRDLAADAMLYAIAQRPAGKWHKYFSVKNPFDIERWRSEEKQADIAFWTDFLQKTSPVERSKLYYAGTK